MAGGGEDEQTEIDVIRLKSIARSIDRYENTKIVNMGR